METRLTENLAKVRAILQDRGAYRAMPKPLSITGVDYEFDFDAIYEGPVHEHNLVIVAIASDVPVAGVVRRLSALTMALRRTGSMRAITLVLVIEKIASATIAELQSVCRVLPVQLDDVPEVVLSPLLPLPIPAKSETLVSAREALLASLTREFGEIENNGLISQLLKAAEHGSNSVEKAVLDEILRAVQPESKGASK